MIKFTKMEGLGNDYVYIDCTKKEIKDISKLAIYVSNRHFGIGSDGLILICKSDIADFRMRMFNSDGSEAEMCGNGIRCVGKFVYDKKLTNKKTITVETLAGIKTLKLNTKGEEVKTVRVDMGEPELIAEKIPCKDGKKFKSKDGIAFEKINLNVKDEFFDFTCVSMGNPHAITYTEKIDKFDIINYGPIVECDEHFPKKTNVEFIGLLNKNNIKMRVWERGAGETLACGTGACAAAVASHLNGYTERKVTVDLLGGKLEIEWSKEDNHVYMTGPAKIVFEGELDDSKIHE